MTWGISELYFALLYLSTLKDMLCEATWTCDIIMTNI